MRLPKNVIALGVVSFFTDASTEIIYPLLPLFLAALGAGPAFIGIIEGIAETTASLLKLIAGWASDRLRARKKIVILGYGLSSLTRPVMAVAAAPWHVLGVRFADRVGKGFRGAPRDALIADSTDASTRGRAFGFHRAMDHAGAVIGPLTAFGLLYVLTSGSNEPVSADIYRTVFWFATVPAALAVITLLFFVREIVPTGEATKGLPSLSLKPYQGSFKAFMVVLALFTLGNSSDAFLLLRASELGVDASHIPLLWVALHVVKSAASVPGSGLSDRIGRRATMRMGWVVYALIYAGFGFATSAWHIWVLFALYGIYFGLTEGTEKAFVADLVPSELRSTAYGIHGFVVGLAALPASVVFGLIWSNVGASVAFLYGGGLALLAAVLIQVLPQFRHTEAAS